MDLFGIGNAVSGIVGAGLSYKGAREANAMNRELAQNQMNFQDRSNKEAMAFSQSSAREAMDFGRQSAQDQMAFQERMSNTAYQRTVEDMKKAGINPILAYNQGGASSPGGSSVSGVSASGHSSGGSRAEMRNEYAGAVGSALQSMQVISQVQQTRAMTDLLRAELPEKKRSSEVYDSKGGSFLKWWKEIVDPLAKTVNSGANLYRAGR